MTSINEYNSLQAISNSLYALQTEMDNPHFSVDKVKPTLEKLNVQYNILADLQKDPNYENRKIEIEKVIEVWKKVLQSYKDKDITLFSDQIFREILSWSSTKELERLIVIRVNKLFQKIAWRFIIVRSQLTKEAYLEQQKMKYHFRNGCYILTKEVCLRDFMFASNHKSIFCINEDEKGRELQEVSKVNPHLPIINKVKVPKNVKCLAASDHFVIVGEDQFYYESGDLQVRDITKPEMPCIQKIYTRNAQNMVISKNFLFSLEQEEEIKNGVHIFYAQVTGFHIWKINNLGLTHIGKKIHEGIESLYADENWLISWDKREVKLWKINDENISLEVEVVDENICSVAVWQNQLITGHSDKQIKIWNSENVKILNAVLEEMKEKNYSFDFVDDTLIDEYLKQVTARNLKKLTAPFRPKKEIHDAAVHSLSVFHNLLFSGSPDKTIKIRDLADPDLPCMATLNIGDSLSQMLITENYLLALSTIEIGKYNLVCKYIWKFKEVSKVLLHLAKNSNKDSLEHFELLPLDVKLDVIKNLREIGPFNNDEEAKLAFNDPNFPTEKKIEAVQRNLKKRKTDDES
jgi:WD40 repeat protein